MLQRHIAICLLIGGCSISSSAETSYQHCIDDRDNDEDGQTDCSDLDCQAFHHCRLLMSQPDAALPFDAGDGDPPLQRPDAGPRDEDAGSDEDAAVDEDAGIGPGPDLPCDGVCGPTQRCVEGECVDLPPAMGPVRVTIVSVGVPSMNGIARCFDTDCISSPFAFCTCPPDPYVVLSRVRGDDAITIGRTGTARNTLMPDFRSMPMTVELAPGDGLIATVMDEDPGLDERLYRCELSPLPAEGRVQCKESILATDYAVEVELMPVPAGTRM